MASKLTLKRGSTVCQVTVLDLVLTEPQPLPHIMQVSNAKEGEIGGKNKTLSLERYRKTMIYWGLHSHLQQSC